MSSRAETLLMQGHQARRERRLDDAKQIFAEAVEGARSSGDSSELIGGLTGLGQIERDLGNTDAALHLYEEAVVVCRTLAEPLKLAHTVRHVGDIVRASGQLDAAGPPYREALEIYRAHPETLPLDLANAIRGFALLQADVGENVQAIELWREAGELYASVSVQAGVDESERQIARLSCVA